MKSIPIIHLHGRLGYLPWETTEAKDTREFTAKVDSTALQTCVSQIKVIHESVSDGRDQDFKKAKALLKKAEHIYFIGFGFNLPNIKRLGIDNLQTWAKTIEATGYKLTQKECSDSAEATNNKVKYFQPFDCIGFCRERVDWA